MGEVTNTTVYWGEFQSVIQLAIAVNGTFAVIPEFIGKNISFNTNLLTKYIIQAKRIEEDEDKAGIVRTDTRISTRLAELKVDYDKIPKNIIALTYKWLRLFCTVSVVVSCLLLVLSAFRYRSAMSYFSQALAIALLLPFFGGVAYAVLCSAVSGFRLKTKRTKLFDEVGEREENLKKSRDGEEENGV